MGLGGAARFAGLAGLAVRREASRLTGITLGVFSCLEIARGVDAAGFTGHALVVGYALTGRAFPGVRRLRVLGVAAVFELVAAAREEERTDKVRINGERFMGDPFSRGGAIIRVRLS